MLRTNNRLKTKIASPIILILITFSLILLLIVRILSISAIKNYIYNDIYSRQYEMFDSISMVLDEVNLLYSRMVLSEDFETVLHDENLSNEEKQMMYKEMMKRVGYNKDLFGDVIIYYDDDIYRNSDESLSINLPNPIFVNKVLDTDKLIEPGQIVKDVNNTNYLIIGKRMVNFPTGDVTGSVFFYLNEDVLKDFSKSISINLGYSFIIENDSFIISHTLNDYVGATIFDTEIYNVKDLPNYEIRTINDEKSIVIVNELPEFNNRYDVDWKIVSVISYDYLLNDISKLNEYILIVGLVLAIIATILSYKISSDITKPIKNIIIGLRNFSKNGKKAPVANVEIKDELWELENTYDEMINKITELIDKNKNEMENQRKLELYALQMQINPHFLYNTLDAIAWMAKIKKQPEIEKTVIALAKFFRISLHKGDKFITVEQEVELIKNFIEIELVRFPDKFTVDYHVSEDVKKDQTLKLILQPIVENAIKHGISQLEHSGHIEINVNGDVDYIYFEVTDDGLGFEPTEALFSNSRLLSFNGGGYGLKNVDERIKLEYGRECGVTITSKTNEGTKVLIKIKRRYK
ncbi:MAG: signal transduction histidine kinase, LytS [Haloplasmataceae bacterium]|jgi:two-component system sensor histidine kinase YesM|nr:signal transduction histidine kinase, LytS [Haloplasmataceae bacterium]